MEKIEKRKDYEEELNRVPQSYHPYVLHIVVKRVEDYMKRNNLGVEDMAEYLGLTIKQVKRLLGGEWNESIALTDSILIKCPSYDGDIK